uniref:3-ketoacyl-[acyl-carrier-protein] reductase beta subunit n=2 Tax=Bos TaxID=9903 RepID=A0AAA9T0B0_BOVIN
MDKVCAVFGGSRGIGRAVARLMAQRGYRLAIVARNLEGARAAAGDLGGDHLALSCDVAKEHDVQNTFEEIEKNLGRVNFLVNAAGINRDNLLVRTNTEDMLSQLHTNLLGSMLTCRAALKTMIKQQRGSIVNVGSVVGLKGNSGQSVYSASKGGLVGFSRALAKEVAKKKIRVNVVAPACTSEDESEPEKPGSQPSPHGPQQPGCQTVERMRAWQEDPPQGLECCCRSMLPLQCLL